ncbi:MAG: sodium/proline symporter [Myxococcota bacterium]
MVTVSFFAFLLMFVAVGLYSARRKRDTPEDYLVASRSVSPWLVALSGVATNSSGFMFIGLTATAYQYGVKESVWLMAGWVLGDWIAWLFVHKNLREQSERRATKTIPEFLGGGLNGGRPVVILAAVLTVVFLGLYASVQLTAGRKALDTFGIDAWIGVLIGAAMVVAYCFAGGIRASIWTDAAQSVVMLAAITVLAIVGLGRVGGPGALWTELAAIDPTLVLWTGGLAPHLFLLFVLGWVFAGFGAVGQPHIMIRFMTLDSPANVRKARVIYIGWFALFSALCILTGLLARPLLAIDDLTIAGTPDMEYVFPILARQLLPGILVGLMLAGLFAATISTADSQILSCAAAVTQDLAPDLGRSYMGVKMGTLGVTALAATFALIGLVVPGMGAVFDLVIFAWSGLAAALGPLLVIRALDRPISSGVALAMMIGGLVTVVVWDKVLELGGYTYAALPGIAIGFMVYSVAAAVGVRDGRVEKA